jgi:hypothetical protein
MQKGRNIMVNSNISVNNNGNTTNYQRSQSFSLGALHGTGANTGRFSEDITGVLVDLQMRDGSYTFTNPRTGEITERPNSWIAVFDDGSLFSWPTYVDQQGNVQPWSRFDASIDLAACAANGIAIHLWKDERKFTHLEIAAGQQLQQNGSVMSMANRQPGNNQAPWQN